MTLFSGIRGLLGLRPGSLPWLVSYDLTLSWRRVRGMFGGPQARTIVLILGAALMSFHAIAFPVAQWFGRMPAGSEGSKLFYPALASATLFVLPWLIS